jgi:hypothetical protein
VRRAQNTWGDDCAVGRLLAHVDRSGGKDSGGARLEVDRPGLVKVPGKDVVVVADGDYGLEDEKSLASDGRATGRGVGVLPQNTVVLFVTADDVFDDSALARRVDLGTVKVLRVSCALSD